MPKVNVLQIVGECIANSYGGTSFNALWGLYCMFSDEELLEREKTR